MFAGQVEKVFGFWGLDIDLDDYVFCIYLGIHLEIIYFLLSFCFFVDPSPTQLLLSGQIFHH
jgi:hypothetical protein